jgi:hypothetical protein
LMEMDRGLDRIPDFLVVSIQADDSGMVLVE